TVTPAWSRGTTTSGAIPTAASTLSSASDSSAEATSSIHSSTFHVRGSTILDLPSLAASRPAVNLTLPLLFLQYLYFRVKTTGFARSRQNIGSICSTGSLFVKDVTFVLYGIANHAK